MKTNSPRKFAAFDIDGTLFRSSLLREVFYELIKMGRIPPEVAEESSRLHRNWRHRVHDDAFEEFEMAIVNYLDNALPEFKISDYEEAAQRVIEKKAEKVYVYTRDLLESLQKQGYFTIAISGSTHEIVGPFAKKYKFDTWLGQKWERGEEYFTGEITKSHTDKDVLLKRFIEEYNLDLTDSYAVGDSNGDVGMLSMVDNPIAFSPTIELHNEALKRGWKIVVERKNVIYELEKHEDSYVLANTK